jgi:hypothetical protein
VASGGNSPATECALALPEPDESLAAAERNAVRAEAPAVTVAAAALTYLAQVTGEQGFDVGLRVAAGPGASKALLAEAVPLRAPDAGEDVAAFAARIADTRSRGSYRRDVAAGTQRWRAAR